MAFSDDHNYEHVDLQNRSITLTKLADDFHDKLPIACRVFEGLYGDSQALANITDYSIGDTLRFLKVIEKIGVTQIGGTEGNYEVPFETSAVYLPDDYQGNFEVCSPYPDGYVFQTVSELADDFPPFVLVQEDLHVGDVPIKIGDRLKMVRKQTNGEQHWIECRHVQSGIALSLPMDMDISVMKRERKSVTTVDDLKDRLPVRVRRHRDISLEMRGVDLRIPGLPDDYEEDLYFTREIILEAELWDSPGKIISIPATTPIMVIPTNMLEEEYGEPEDIHDIAKRVIPGKPVFATLAICEKELEDLGFASHTVVAIHSNVKKEGIIVKGLETGLLVPKDFQGKFKLMGKEYATAFDLLQSGFKGKVRATKTCEVADSLKIYKLDSVYEFDVVQVVEKQDVDDLARILLQHDEIEIIDLERTMSTKGKLGTISVPSYLKANFVGSTPSGAKHCLFNFIEYEWVPTKASFSVPQDGKASTDEDLILAKESPMEVLGLYKYSVTYVTVHDPRATDPKHIQMAREIPNFVKVQARQILSSHILEQTCNTTYREPRTSVMKLKPDTFNDIDAVVNKDKMPKTEVSYEPVTFEKPRSPPRPPKPLALKPRLPTPPTSPKTPRTTRSASASESTNKLDRRPDRRQSYQEGKSDTKEKRSLFRTLSRAVPTRNRSKSSGDNAKLPRRRDPSKEGGRRSKLDVKSIPIVEPPADGDISHFTVEQLAGLMRHLKFKKDVVENCLEQQIDGLKLCKMAKLNDDSFKTKLRLDNDVQLFSLRHFISKSKK